MGYAFLFAALTFIGYMVVKDDKKDDKKDVSIIAKAEAVVPIPKRFCYKVEDLGYDKYFYVCEINGDVCYVYAGYKRGGGISCRFGTK